MADNKNPGVVATTTGAEEITTFPLSPKRRQRQASHVGNVGRTRLYSRRLAGMLADTAAWPRYCGTSPDGTRLTVWTLCGQDAWHTARLWEHSTRLFLLAPPGEPPEVYNWALLRGHDPVLLACHGAMFDERALVTAIMRDGVRRVLSDGTRYLAEVAHA